MEEDNQTTAEEKDNGKQKYSDVDKGHLLDEVGSGIELTGVLAGGVFFALSLLLTNFNNKLMAPLIFLFLSLFGFVYGSLIYANASGQLSRIANKEKAIRTLEVGNVISEVMGVYPLIFAFPIAFLWFTNLVTSVIALSIALFGYIFYHTPGDILGSYSIIERYSEKVTYFVISTCSILLVTNFAVNYVNIEYGGYSYLTLASLISTLIAYAIIAIYCLFETERTE